MYATAGGQTDSARRLLELGADASIKDKHGGTALDYARAYKQTAVVALLEAHAAGGAAAAHAVSAQTAAQAAAQKAKETADAKAAAERAAAAAALETAIAGVDEAALRQALMAANASGVAQDLLLAGVQKMSLLTPKPTAATTTTSAATTNSAAAPSSAPPTRLQTDSHEAITTVPTTPWADIPLRRPYLEELSANTAFRTACPEIDRIVSEVGASHLLGASPLPYLAPHRHQLTPCTPPGCVALTPCTGAPQSDGARL